MQLLFQHILDQAIMQQQVFETDVFDNAVYFAPYDKINIGADQTYSTAYDRVKRSGNGYHLIRIKVN